jgi:Hermes transposase DNA-binding domain
MTSESNDVDEVETESGREYRNDRRRISSSSSNRYSTSSDVYTFIVDDPSDKGAFYCKCCKDLNKSKKWTNRSTTNFRRHLIKEHRDRYISLDANQTKLTHHGFSRPSPKVCSKRNLASSADFGPSDKRHADEKLSDWIINDSQSFSVVEQKDFIELCETLRLEYPVPTRNTVKNRILCKWEDEKCKVRQRLEMDCTGKRVGTTTDMWTSSAKRG